ncbi:MAG TPA: hypothetical protein DCR14_21140 [Acidimicrobiaceae bacterium]|nr:hypothetical protein [Acidimicrobiaceae bacterium]
MASHRALSSPHLLSFAADDVAANRVGQLSEVQRRSLRRASSPPPWIGTARTVVVVGSSVTIAWLMWRAESMETIWKLAATGLAIDVLSLLAVVAIRRRAASAATRCTVQVVEGVPQFAISGTSPLMTLELGGARWAIRPADSFLFRKGVAYRLYHTVNRKGSPVLLSAEAVAPVRAQ